MLIPVLAGHSKLSYVGEHRGFVVSSLPLQFTGETHKLGLREVITITKTRSWLAHSFKSVDTSIENRGNIGHQRTRLDRITRLHTDTRKHVKAVVTGRVSDSTRMTITISDNNTYVRVLTRKQTKAVKRNGSTAVKLFKVLLYETRETVMTQDKHTITILRQHAVTFSQRSKQLKRVIYIRDLTTRQVQMVFKAVVLGQVRKLTGMKVFKSSTDTLKVVYRRLSRVEKIDSYVRVSQKLDKIVVILPDTTFKITQPSGTIQSRQHQTNLKTFHWSLRSSQGDIQTSKRIVRIYQKRATGSVDDSFRMTMSSSLIFISQSYETGKNVIGIKVRTAPVTTKIKVVHERKIEVKTETQPRHEFDFTVNFISLGHLNDVRKRLLRKAEVLTKSKVLMGVLGGFGEKTQHLVSISTFKNHKNQKITWHVFVNSHKRIQRRLRANSRLDLWTLPTFEASSKTTKPHVMKEHTTPVTNKGLVVHQDKTSQVKQLTQVKITQLVISNLSGTTKSLVMFVVLNDISDRTKTPKRFIDSFQRIKTVPLLHKFQKIYERVFRQQSNSEPKKEIQFSFRRQLRKLSDKYASRYSIERKIPTITALIKGSLGKFTKITSLRKELMVKTRKENFHVVTAKYLIGVTRQISTTTTQQQQLNLNWVPGYSRWWCY
eukprot:sb/3462803/